MSFYGENNLFSFRDNICEQITKEPLTVSQLAEFGSKVNFNGKIIAVGFESDMLKSYAYSLASGIAQQGCNVIITENAVLPAFICGLNKISVSYGMYISSANPLIIQIYNGFGVPCSSEFLLNNSKKEKNCSNIGKISSYLHINELYLNEIHNSFENNTKINAGISCGNKSIINMWSDFFADNSDEIILQISQCGTKVNIYSSETGFISHEKLMLAYALHLMKNKENPALPENIHFIAQELAEKHNCKITEGGSDYNSIILKQRFTIDPLFLCIQLLNKIDSFYELCSEIPDFYTAKREFSTEYFDLFAEKTIIDNNGRIKISNSGKKRITLTAQAYNAETAAELCCFWQNKINSFSHSHN